MPKTLASFTAAQNTKIETELRKVAQFGEKGQLQEAQRICDRILSDFPDHPRALYYSGLTALQMGNHQNALGLMEKVQSIEPNQPADFYQNLGIVYAGLNLFDKSIEHLQFSLQLNARSPQAHFNLALVYSKKGDTTLAVHHYEKTIALMPNYFTAHNSLGNIFQEQGKIEKALQHYQQAISINPRYAESFANRAGLYKKIKSYSLAEKNYQTALSIKPDFIEARNNYGVLLMDIESYRAALEQFTLILKHNPNYIHTLKNAGDLSHRVEHYLDAAEYYRAGLKQEPDNLSFINSLMQTLKAQAHWDDEFAQVEKKQLRLIRQSLQKKEKLEFSPFSSLSMNFNDEEQLTIAANHAEHTFQAIMHLPAVYKSSVFKASPHRLRIGYLSADLRDHPVCHLLSGVLETHDLRRFDVIAYYIGPSLKADKYQERVIRSVNQFTPLNNLTEEAAAQRIAKDGVHILVDLMGYTQYARPEILAYRPAPVQIGFFGYPGTSGARFMDYYIVDKVVVPPTQSKFFSERLIYLPDSYLPTDNRMGIAPELPSRAYYGLPEKAFVFCCFCNHYKLNAEVFNAWIDILKAVPNSVLWLFSSNEFFETNLKTYAEKSGIEENRLIFAKKEPKEKHVARYQLAHLFLDTFVYNAHATAIDALWAGLPLITYPGNSMATRVSASLLTTLRLPQLITHSVDDYVESAVTLAKNPQQLNAIHQHLQWARQCLALFNTTRYTQYLEEAYRLAFDQKVQKTGNEKNPIIISDQMMTLTSGCEKSQLVIESSTHTETKTHSHRRYQSSNNGGALETQFEWTNGALDTSQVPDTDESLPDAAPEKIAKTIQRAAEQGAVRGVSNVVEYAMKRMGYLETTAERARQALYYGGFFATRLYHRMDLSSDTLTAASQAAIETGMLFCAQQAIQATSYAGDKMKEHDWCTTSKLLKAFSNYLGYALYAQDVQTHGITPFAASIAVGSATQTAVEIIGKAGVEHVICAQFLV